MPIPVRSPAENREAHRPLPAWDRFDAYLFDIDGTLLNCRDAVHYFAFCDALSWVAGRPLNLDGVQTHGNTDVGILADALRLASVDEVTWRPHLAAMQQRMADAVARDGEQIVAELVPGVRETLQHLRARGALLGVATGNLESIGWTKLRRADLREFFRFGGFSDHAHTRTEIFAAAARQAQELCSHNPTVCVVGDTPADITSARANRLRVIAVATGTFTAAELGVHQPDWCVPTLADLPRSHDPGSDR